MAVDKNKSYMGRRYVEVFRAKKLVSSLSWNPGVPAQLHPATSLDWGARHQHGDSSSSETAYGCDSSQHSRGKQQQGG